MGQVQISKGKMIDWINITKATNKEINELKKEFKFNQLDLVDSLYKKKAQRPKIFFRKDYFFLVLLFPTYNKNTKEIQPAEIDIFITKNKLITIVGKDKGILKKLFEETKSKKSHLNQSPAMLLYEILNELYTAIFPMLDHLSQETDNIEKQIFEGKIKETVKEIFITKRNIANFQKTLQVHKSILRKLVFQKNSFLDNSKLTIYYNDLVDHTKNIWDTLDNYQKTITALEQSNNSLATFKINNIMRILTVFSVMILPLTFIAAIFTMDVSWMPIRDTAFDWYKIVGIMIVFTLSMLFWFKKKKII